MMIEDNMDPTDGRPLTVSIPLANHEPSRFDLRGFRISASKQRERDPIPRAGICLRVPEGSPADSIQSTAGHIGESPSSGTKLSAHPPVR